MGSNEASRWGGRRPSAPDGTYARPTIKDMRWARCVAGRTCRLAVIGPGVAEVIYDFVEIGVGGRNDDRSGLQVARAIQRKGAECAVGM